MLRNYITIYLHHHSIDDVSPLVTASAIAERRVVACSERAVQREVVSRFKNIRVVTRAKDLPLIPLPLRLIDSINPVLDLHDDTAVLLNHTRVTGLVEETLGLLQRESACKEKSARAEPKVQTVRLTILATTRVNLESLLVGPNVNLNSSERTGKCGDRPLFSPVIWSILIAVDQVASIVTSAVSTAVTKGLREVCANLFRSRPEVVNRILLVRKDSAIRYQDSVCSNSLARIGEMEGPV